MAALRTLLVLAVAAGILVLTPSASWACSCAMVPTAASVKHAETVVDGTLKWVASNGVETTYSVSVDKVYKGRAAAREKLVGPADEAACGLGSLATDERYLFFINGTHPGRMRVSLCGGTVPYDARTAAEIQAVTGVPRGPMAPPVVSGPVTKDPDEGTRWLPVVGSSLAVGLVLGGLLLLARRFRS
ncbi:hypothetical protein [Nocardioides marmoriginsengisoli]|uniref:hypothetical protein n=1 Tax=Nocardioides marmoriginsengisoli TaxID=661483 RepID=UPI0016104037|nr:hypothetical protein [Nocardioides marmoriginsengisoli]